MLFTWKGTPTKSVYASNTRPELNMPGPYPTRPPNDPETITKLAIQCPSRMDSNGQYQDIYSYYDPMNKKVYFGQITIPNVISTSLPNVCLKKLSRPLKIWRKRLDMGTSRTKVTLNQVNGVGSSVTSNPIHCIQTDIPKIIDILHIRRSGGKVKSCNGQLPQTTCMSTREYLQKRCKTYEQNQAKGVRIDPYTYKSSECTKNCSTIVIKPSNKEYKTQGGVSSSSRTNNLKYKTIQAKNVNANYATARSSLDFGRVNVQSQNPPPKVCLTVRQDRVHETSCPYVKRK
jgi:hypothetical protein